MHPYATDSPERQHVPLILAAFSFAIAWLLRATLEALQLHLPWWLEAPSFLTFYGILYTAFDKSLWRRATLRRLGIVRAPVLDGEWTGVLKTSHDSHQGERPITMTVKQTWTNLSVRVTAGQSGSHSLMASLLTNAEEGPTLIFSYMNKPHSSAADGMHMHCGTTQLTLDKGGNELSGDYYTGRDRNTWGEIRVARVKPQAP